MLSFITGSKKIIVPYLIFIDENYYYMAKDKIVNQRKPNLRRIGNKYDLLKLSNFQTSRKNNDYEFAFEFVNQDIFDRTFKLLYFTPKEAQDFYTVLHAILGGFGIQIPENLDDEGEEEEEEEEGEEYEEGEEEGENEEKEGQGEGEGEGENENKNQKDNKNNENKIQKEDNKKIKKEDEDNEDEKEENENEESNEKKVEIQDKIREVSVSTKEESKDNNDIEVSN